MVQSLDGHDLWRTDQTGEGANETDLMALLLAAPDPRLMCKRWLVGLTGNDRAACEDLGQTNAPEKPLDWKRLLERYGGQSPRLVPSFSRPPRRFPRLVGVVPGHKHVRTRPKIMAVVDTSGSMDQATLRRISGQLKHIEREGEVTVVECDKEIQATYRLRGPVEKVHGRGDTDLRPPLACEFLAKVRPHVIVYFTDGDGPAPQHAPNLPVLWCLTKQGKKPAPWGHVVRMPN
jgi:predicted metal-dependent peptidase